MFYKIRRKLGLTRLGLLRYKIKFGIFFNRFPYLNENENTDLIVSMTTFPERFNDVFYALYSIFKQKQLPNKIILWLSREEFDEENFKPYFFLRCLVKHGLEIKFCEHIRSFKKYIPCLKLFPNSWIATADDDVYYDENWLLMLYNNAKSDPIKLHCHSGHIILRDEGKLKPYNEWPDTTDGMEVTGYNILPITVAGLIMKLDLLNEDVLKHSIFEKVVPKNDDIWLWAQCLLKGTKIHIIANNIWNFRDLGADKTWTKLFTTNGIDGNDIQMKAILDYYPKLNEIIGG